MKKLILLLLLLSVVASSQQATFQLLKAGDQAVIDPSAVFEAKSTSKALLVPRMTTTQKNAIASPASGDLIYDTSLNQFSGYQNGSWSSISSNFSIQVGAIDSGSSTLNGATISGNTTIIMQSANSSYPGLVNNSAQTFSGLKTFSSTPTFSALNTAGVLLNSSVGVLSSSSGPLAIANGGIGSATTSQNFAFIGPTSGSGAPSFRGIVSADIPTLNQNTTGTASNITASSNSSLTTLSSLSLPTSQLSGILPIANGGNNSGAGLLNNRLMVSSAGTIGELQSGQTVGYILTATSNIPQFAPNTPAASNITGTLAVAHGGTNSAAGLLNNRFIVSSGGTIGEGALISANCIVGSDSNGLPKTISLPLSAVNGGTNSKSTLLNNRFIVSSGGTIGEGTIISANSIVGSDSNGLPTTISIPIPIADGGTNSKATLANNRVVVTSGGTIGEFSPGTSGQFLESQGSGSAPIWGSALSNPMTTTGDIIYSSNGSGTPARLAIGSSNSVMTVTGGIPSWQAAGSSPTASYAQAYHTQASAPWTTSSESYADPTAGGTPALTVRQHSGITLTTAGSSLPGITFTPAVSTAVYLISADFLFDIANGCTSGARLYDGTTVIAQSADQSLTATGLTDDLPMHIQGIYVPGTSSAVTVKIQIYTCGSAGSIGYGSLGNTIEWSIIRLF